MKLKCQLPALILGCFHPRQMDTMGIVAFFMCHPSILEENKYINLEN